MDNIKKYWKGLNWRGNIYVALILSLLLVLLLYSVSRVAFYFFNTPFFPAMNASRMLTIMAGGLRFDLSATLYSNSLFILLMIVPLSIRFHPGYQKTLKWIFLIVNSIAFAINTSDFIYYRFTLRRTTLSVIDQFKNEGNLFKLGFQFVLDYWYATLFWVVLVVLLYAGFKKITYSGPQLKNRLSFYGVGILAMLLSIYLFVGGARGGFRGSTRPITLSNAAAYAETPNEIALVLNTPFALMRTAKANVIKKVNYFTSDENLRKTFDPIRSLSDTGQFKKENVVILILESFSKEFVGVYNKDMMAGAYKGYTPFLDSLIGVSYAFQYSLANGRKSIDAMPSVVCSIPSIEVPYILSHYSGDKINSLASLLKPEGYYTAFFHGAPNGSMGFDAFANMAGFDHYFGKTEYNNDNDFDGIWGIWDEPFLQFFAEKMNTFPQPFFTTLFTVSSHHPYQLPEGYENKFKGGPKLVHRTIEYTDYSLRKFFNKARKMPWFEHTLFVISADHASAEIQLPEYNSAWGYFSIPIFFYKPGEGGRSMKDEIIQQIDIMPSVLGHLHYPKPYLAFGQNVFAGNGRQVAVNYLDNTYQLFRGDYLFQFDGNKPKALYTFKTDRFLKNNLILQLPDTVKSMENYLKAFVQQYNNRMVDNSLTIEGSQLQKLHTMK
ncbi:MAG: Phosphoglycerol transferase-like protein [Cytophagales bacterium]|jgi:phosphoglycerol transferase MdoB-like AlkP superfamily enzyme|nr:sulfatase-like hydrolase/transferase [Bacteroidota bacterium]MBS1981332.1 sulfatase-like hydrolase/transferase [Bacteroidota bacterium]WHZ09351.1 MAG: Phosphoglycerol transferase-like protein [Cytophagales bacterium]